MENQNHGNTYETIPMNSQIDIGSDQSSQPLLTNESSNSSNHFNPIPSAIEEIYQAKHITTNYFKFTLEVFAILKRTVGYTIICSLLLVLPIVMIAIGAKFENKCPIQPMIPKFLIVGGSFLVLKLSLSIRQQAQEPKIYEDNYCHFDCYVVTEKGISLFLFIWFLLGNIWVFTHANNRAIWQAMLTIVIAIYATITFRKRKEVI